MVYGKNSYMNESIKISKSDAVSIAKDYLIKQQWASEYRLDKISKIELESLYKYEDGTLTWIKLKIKMNYVVQRKRWNVVFIPKVSALKGGFHLFIKVNAETGVVEDAGNYKY